MASFAPVCCGVHTAGVCPTRKTHLWQRGAQRVLVGVLLPILRPAVLLLQVLPVLHRRVLRCRVLRRRRLLLLLLLHPVLHAAAARFATAPRRARTIAARTACERGSPTERRLPRGHFKDFKRSPRASSRLQWLRTPTAQPPNAAARPSEEEEGVEEEDVVQHHVLHLCVGGLFSISSSSSRETSTFVGGQSFFYLFHIMTAAAMMM